MMLARAIANTYRKTKGVGSKQKNFSPKRFSVYDKTAIFSIQPYPAHVEEKQNYLSSKSGFIIAEFLPTNGAAATQKYDYEGKKTVFLFPSEIGVLLSLPTLHPGTICNKSPTNPDVKKIINITKIEDNHELKYIEMNKEIMVSSITVNLKPNDLAVIQALLKYCLPHLIGWTYLSTLNNVERNLEEDQSNTQHSPSPFKDNKVA